MSGFIMSIGLASRMRVLFRSAIRRPIYQNYQCSSLLLAGMQNSVDRTDTRLESTTQNSIIINHLHARNLYSESILGIWKLDKSRERRNEMIGDGRERFFARLNGLVESKDYKSLIEEDLVNMIALAESEEHLEMVETIALCLTNESDRNYPIGHWGSQVMRLYYRMNQVDRAYNKIKDERFGEFFHQATAFLIAMTMMYNSGRYNHVVELYELSRGILKYQESQIFTARRVLSLVFASYAKMNTPESFEEAMKLFHQENSFIDKSIRVIAFLAYLAGNQGKPSVSLNLISRIPGQGHLLARNIKFVNLLRMERYDDIVYILRLALDTHNSDKVILFKDVHQLIKEKLGDCRDGGTRDNLMIQLTKIEEGIFVAEETLESGLFSLVNKARNMDLPSTGKYGRDQGRRQSPKDEQNPNDIGSDFRRQPDSNFRKTHRGGRRNRVQRRSYFEDGEFKDTRSHSETSS